MAVNAVLGVTVSTASTILGRSGLASINGQALSGGGGGGITLISSASAKSPDGNSITTGAINTTGANFLVATIADFGGSGLTTTIEDSKENTWTRLTVISALSQINNAIFFCASATVGTGHTFTASGTTTYPSICVAAFSGVDAAPFDQENGTSNGGGGTNLTTGSVTPSTNDQLIIAGLGFTDSGASINSGFTIIQQQGYTAAQAIGSALAYLVQTTATPVNPEWSWGSGATASATIATFEP